MTISRTPAAAVLSAALLAAFISGGLFSCGRKTGTDDRIGMAVEFMDHAAAAYVARDKGWYEEQGVSVSSYTSYVTGMALASALARGDIQVAYMCLVPAINARANARVPIKIVAGTHKYGYALVVNPQVVKSVRDLAGDGVRLGCVREGGAVDVLMNRTIDRYGLERRKIMDNTRRMNPPKLLIAIESGQLDAAFLPEQWASMAEDAGFEMLVTAQDVWPGMQGSVLVVKEELLRESPEAVRKLVRINEDASRWINEHPGESADILVRVLSVAAETTVPAEASALTSRLEMNPETMLRSMSRLEYSTEISARDVQEVIDYLARLGYIDESFPAEEIVDMRFAQ